jgi:hypothetical protein
LAIVQGLDLFHHSSSAKYYFVVEQMRVFSMSRRQWTVEA